MPVERIHLKETTESGLDIGLRPDTHAYRILRFLAEREELAFTPKEISEGADVPHGSVSTVLSRLENRDLVEHISEYWAIGDDERLASHVAMLYSQKAIESQYGDDYYAQNPGWATDLEDLGENA